MASVEVEGSSSAQHDIKLSADGENDRRIVAAGDGDAEGGSVVMTDGKVIVLADDEGVNTIVEAVDGSGVVRTGTGRRRQHRCGLGCR